MDNTELKAKIENYLTTILNFLDIEYSLAFEETAEENQLPQSKDCGTLLPSCNKIYINISSQNDSLLVGYHANNLNSLQHLVNLFSYKEAEGHPIIVVDVGGYRKNRENKLKEMAKEVADKAKELGKSISLYPMSSYERRIVHEAIAAIDGVTSFSEGEGPERKIIVSLEKKDEI